MEFTLPALANFFPVLSTVPLAADTVARLVLTPDSPESSTLCSSLNQQNSLSLLTHSQETVEGGGIQLRFRPLYQHLNRSRCEWEFSVWYSLDAMLEDCGGEKLNTTMPAATGAAISLTTVSTYLHFQADGTVLVHGNQSSTVLSTEGLSPPGSPPNSLHPPPLHLLPQNGAPLSYLYPLSIRGREGLVDLVLYVATPANTSLLPSHRHLQQHLHLLFSSTSGTSHVWLLQSPNNEVLLGFEGHQRVGSGCVECEQNYTFSLSLGANEEGVSLLLDVATSLQRDSFTIGTCVCVCVCRP